MASPKGNLLYRIYYGDHIVYVGRTRQELQTRIRGHMFAKRMHKNISIHSVSKIEYAECKTQADMYLYEIYYICKLKPDINRDDKPRDNLTLELPELEWKEFKPANWEKWKEELKDEKFIGWKKRRNNRLNKKYERELVDIF